jgi:MoaA/NifB/PqqE/SkfB family radical SAM enzyme
MNENEIRDRIKKYFNSVGVNTVVTKKNYNDKDEVTDVAEEVKKSVYEIKLDRLVATPSTSAMSIMKGSTKSEITLDSNVQVSGPPMSGQW